jgi:dipeptidyl aminopeptidase/acylaminoacyl peptidase
MLSSRRASCTVILCVLTLSLATAQAPRVLSPEEYARWEQLVAHRSPLSPDGRWFVYGVNRSSRQNELRVHPSSGGDAVVIPFGEQPAFSDDSRWLAYLVGFSEEQEARLRKEKKPLHKSLGLLELGTGKTTTIEGVESFTLSPSGSHVAMRRYGPERPEASASASSVNETSAPGTTLVLRELSTGRDWIFGAVSEATWQEDGTLLAMATTGEGNIGNGVQVFDTATNHLRVLDSSSSTYAGLVWREDSAALAALRSESDEARDGPAHVVLVWPDLVESPSAMRVLDAAETAQLGRDQRIVRFRTPRWSDDGAFLFVGVAPWYVKPDTVASEGAPRRVVATSTNPDELPDVQVWHPNDPVVMPRQKLDARRDRERSMLAAWRLADDRLIQVATTIGEEATPVPRSSRAVVIDTNAFAMDRSIGRVRANVWTVDLQTGTRRDIASGIEDRYVQASPAGRYVLYLLKDQYWAFDLASGRTINLTAGINTSFVDRESDATTVQKPAFGVAGWTEDDRKVLLYDKFDIWEVNTDGSGGTRVTNGAPDLVRHRYARLDPDEKFIDRSKPLMISVFGVRSKKSGYARLQPGATVAATPAVWLDKRVDRLVKAARADQYAYVAQAFDDSPDYFVAGDDLSSAKQVTKTNAFMSEYAWGRAVLVEYRNQKGVELQGSLFYPAGYEPGTKYPMVVYMYEKLSDNLHQFSPPSERDYYNAAAFTARGYFYFQPDIVFRPRDPGLSVVDSVIPAVQRVIGMGMVDAARVGIVGHSWGGFDSVYLATHTDTFAAAVAGAPITNLVSNYGNHHWSSGIAETDHIETGQQRMEVPIYEDLPAYIRNSAVYRAHTMKTPLLVMFGDNDGTVHWHQGVELYNIARRAGKKVVLLQYGGEDHGLRKRANQIDYHHRIFEWFDHYLKGAAPSPWISNGERYIDRERDLQQRKRPAKPTTTTTVTPQGDK